MVELVIELVKLVNLIVKLVQIIPHVQLATNNSLKIQTVIV